MATRSSVNIKNIPKSSASTGNNATAVSEVVIGTIVDVDSFGIPWVDYSGNPQSRPLQALTTASVRKHNIGRQAALLFSEGNPEKPVVIGLIKNILDQELSAELSLVDTPNQIGVAKDSGLDVSDHQPKKVIIDGERMEFTADKEIVLKCGKASITLTRAGKILIRGAYLSNRSSGVNRIKGGSVQIN